MFELLFTVLVAVIVYNNPNVWLSMMIILLHMIFVFPGLYAMMFGAPFVPSSDKRIKLILKLADLKKSDVVYDLGCGDGRLVRSMANMGVENAIGYEYSVPTYLYARLKKWFARSDETIRFGNFWKKDFSKANVLTCFLLENSMKDFEKKIWPNLSLGTKVVSNTFKLPNVSSECSSNGVHLYVKK